MGQIHYRTCNLCEALCGIEIEHQNGEILSIRGDKNDPLSKGHICPKALALGDIYNDPDRLRRPMRRQGDKWEEISWQAALDEVGQRLNAIRKEHGRHAVATYVGNPTVHNYGALIYMVMLMNALHTSNKYSATSLDQLPRMFASLMMYGHHLMLPIPDIDRTQHMLILGANPAASNGSIMSAPDVVRRLKDIQKRGGKVITVDPRFTETSRIADEHHYIRPGGDAFLLLGMLHTLFAEGLTNAGRLEPHLAGLDRVAEFVSNFPAKRVAKACGIPAKTIESMAREFAKADKAVAYGRVGTCTQEFGGLTTWLIDILNIVTGNLDNEGGLMFAKPAFDLVKFAGDFNQRGHFGRRRSRVSKQPEFGGEFPMSVLAEEIETPGKDQIRALITHAGNPVLSAPNGQRLDKAFASLDFMVSIDIYLNETTRHADIILPPAHALEVDQYEAAFYAVAVRNVAKYSPALFEPDADSLPDWKVILGILERLEQPKLTAKASAFAFQKFLRLGPKRIVDLLIRSGEAGDHFNPLSKGLTLKKLLRYPSGIDLGPLTSRLPELLYTKSKKIELVPGPLMADLKRLDDAIAEREKKNSQLLLIGRRHVMDNNSWMHNSERLMRGRPRCTLIMHPDDASKRKLSAGDEVRVSTSVGEVVTPVEITDKIAVGVVSLPHGYGHGRKGIRMRVAAANPGISMNDLISEEFVDPLTGTAQLSGIPVEVSAAL